MFTETLTSGLGLIVAGILLLAVVAGLVHLARRQPGPAAVDSAPEVKNHPHASEITGGTNHLPEAVLVIRPGGKIDQLNEAARLWFRENEAQPNLERLAGHTHPAEAFLGLCAVPGQAQFTLDGRLLLGTSYSLLQAGQPMVLVSLRQAQSVLMDGSAQPADQIRLWEELTRKLNASLDLLPTLAAILECVEQLIPADLAQISLWDAAAQRLTLYRFLGSPGVDRRLEKAPSHTWIGSGFASQIVETRQVVWINDLQANQETPTLPAGAMLQFRSYLGTPVLDGDIFLGTIELIAVKPESFQVEKRDALVFISGLAAQAIQNSFHFNAERTLAAELRGLTDLTQALREVSDPEILFSRLAESIYPLLDVEIMGFWLYDEGRRQLYGQNPFYGLPPNVVDWRRLAVLPDSAAEELISRGELISSDQPALDPRLEALGLQPIAQAAAIRHMILAPLASAGRVVGYLQAANPHSGLKFDEASVHRLVQIAAQVSPIIDNAYLVQDAHRRVQRAETLRRIASLTSSTATLDEILKYSMLDLARLLQADAGAILLRDAESGELRPHQVSLFGIEAEQVDKLSSQLISVAEFSHTVTGSLHALLSSDLEQETLLPLYRALVGELGLHSGLIVPLVTRERGAGELLIASRQLDFYDRNDERSALTAAGQLASAIERAALYSQTDKNLRQKVDQLTALTQENTRLLAETRSLTQDLEKRVALRTTELAAEHQRTETLLRIITELSASLDLDQVLQRTLKVLNEFIGAQKLSIWLSSAGQTGFRRLATLDGDRPLITTLDQEQALAEQVVHGRAALCLDDLAVDESDLWSPYVTGSVLAVPVRIGAEILGVLQAISDQAGYFTPGHRELAQAAANQIAVAANNAELYSLIRDQAEGLGGMLRDQQIATSRSQAILEAVADGVLVTDNQMKITLFNASAEKIVGLRRSQVLGKSLEHFSGMFGRVAQAWIDTIQYWSQEPASAQTGEAFAEKLDLENGRVVEVRLAPVSLRSDFLGTVSIFQDVTHQVEVDRLKSEFVATVSHELRTPMTSIKGYVEIMLMGAAGSLSDRQTHFLEVVRENTDRLTVLVDDLLNISRIESGRIELLPQPLDLDRLVSDALLVIEQRAAQERKSIHLHKDFPLDLPRAWGDVERVRQVLENLLDNAYLYNVEGGSIQVRAMARQAEIQVDVMDTGLGIPPDEQERVFERFYRGENPLTLGVSGTGLGLSIVQSLVQMQGGRIWLESQGIPGKGSTFSFTLPVVEGQEQAFNEATSKGNLQWQRS